MMFAMTWNLDGRPASRYRLLQHLAQQRELGVVAVQEWVPEGEKLPNDTDIQAEIEASTSGRFTLAASGQQEGRQLLIASSELSASRIRRDIRLVSVNLASKSEKWSGLRVVGVHARSRLHAEAEESRELHMDRLLAALRSHWAKGPAIVLGDFNAEPYANEMVLLTRLAACRERREVMFSTAEPTRRVGRLLYNPTWALLTDPVHDTQPAGTYFRTRDNFSDRWHCYDQLLVSHEFASCWKADWNPQLVPVLSGHDALLKGHPQKQLLASDHVPVVSYIKMHEVVPWRS